MAASKEDPGRLSYPTMVRWFSPTLLANAAVRAVISPIFGTFADARSAQASADGYKSADLAHAAQRFDYSVDGITADGGAVWVDYVADTGDGFDPSYAVASLVSADKLTVARRGSKDSIELPTGRLLILGGDQVYPYPTRDEYRERFEVPFRMAFSGTTQPRLAFAIPGNHDWYDGLNSFDFLFCQARYGVDSGSRIGKLEFPQHRSYFAIRLPHNWWIWGCDVQFSQYLDAGQVRYFQAVAEIMKVPLKQGEPEHKVILCIAEPGWQYEGSLAANANSNLSIIASLADSGNAKVCAVLAGDTHHYSRYYSSKLGLNLITAGGGGAFLHPTHQLTNEVGYEWLGETHKFDLYCRQGVKAKGPSYEAAVFPSRRESFWLTWGNLVFPFWNYTFATLLGTLYWLMTWMYSQTPVERVGCKIDGRDVAAPLVEKILVYNTDTCGLAGKSMLGKIPDLINVSMQAGIYQFLLGILCLTLWYLLVRYADAKRRWKQFLMGTAHWLAHIMAMVGLYMAVNYYGLYSYGGAASWINSVFGPVLGSSVGIVRTAAYMLQMIFGGGIVAGFVWGLYLFTSCAFGKRHTNDAFSAMRYPDYKNFLRFKLEPNTATIYPIGIRRTPTRLEWQQGSGRDEGKLVPLIKLAPELIDGPIVIDANEVRMRAAASA